MANIAILARGKVIRRFAFFLRVVVAALAITSDTHVIEAGGEPRKCNMATLAFRCSENVLSRLSSCYYLVVAAGTGLCNGIMIERCRRPGKTRVTQLALAI